jgi:peptidoglycan/xylan/chitin deacetylase (PgdA/CDA1 family)
MRFDRLVSLYLARPLCCGNWGSPAGRLPILMYHSVSSDPEKKVPAYYRLTTSPTRFAEQMQWLGDLGHTGMALEEALPMLANGKLNIVRPVAITFDDGFRDFQMEAWPILHRHGFSATMYLPTGFVSQRRKMMLGKECLTWDEVRELRRQGMRFGSHTVTHPKLYQLGWNEIEREIADSKEHIQDELEEEVTSFAYPYAFPKEDRCFSRKFGDLLRKAGYRNCATTVIGRVQTLDDPFYLKRLPANHGDDQALFAAKLNGAYDWLGPVQSVFRSLKKGRGRSEFSNSVKRC